MLADRRPFVLLDDARTGDARLYRDPVQVVTATTIDAVRPALDTIRDAVARGQEAAGYLSYEAGAAFVARAPLRETASPLLWFGLFDGHRPLDPDALAALLPDPAGVWIGDVVPAITRDAYDTALTRVLDLIRAGDIYQANLTFAASVRFVGDPLGVYARLRLAARAGHGAVVSTGDATLLSLSPESFFTLDGDALVCRPMKGTARRGDTADQDRALAHALATDAKQRAENLMIVDLMRNDLSRVAAAGSVAVPDLFRVETYPTIHQMTSTVTARLADGCDAIDVVAALFPCGSITGAPKQRAMAVIADIEARDRGVYTGSIGRIDATGAAFNVAIRTLSVRDPGIATLGLGSGIVADSRADEEWSECFAKAAFVGGGAARSFDLIETMAFDPAAGLLRIDSHLARLAASAATFGFALDLHHVRNELQAATFRLQAQRRVRLLVARSGAIAIEVAAMPVPIEGAISVAIVPLPVARDDFRLRHKTSDRAFYDDARRAAGTAEVVFERDGLLTEGSFTSLFAVRGDGMLVTPGVEDGLLPGILRQALIDDGRAVPGEVRRADLAGGFFVGNAVRGLIAAHVADANAATL